MSMQIVHAGRRGLVRSILPRLIKVSDNIARYNVKAFDWPAASILPGQWAPA